MIYYREMIERKISKRCIGDSLGENQAKASESHFPVERHGTHFIPPAMSC